MNPPGTGSTCPTRTVRAMTADRRDRGRADRGDANMWLIMIVGVAFALTMLLVDGSAKRQGSIRAHWYAAEAARAAVTAVGPRPDGPAAGVAAAAASAYLAGVGVPGAVQVRSPSSVRVDVTVITRGPMSGLTWTSTQSVTADLLVGVEQGQSR